MAQELSLAAVFLVGLLGGGHCAGMCGGIVGALSAQPGGGKGLLHFAYSSGRIASYSVAGAIAGSVGGLGLLFSDALPVQLGLYVLANVMLLILGLYLAGLSPLAARFEAAGGFLWRHVQPWTRHFLPADTMPRALAVGALWGWIPCGLVYGVLATALLSGSAGNGALVMLAFGLGTLPNLLLAGLLLRRAARVFQGRVFRTVCGALVFGFGMSGLAHAFDLTDRIRAGLLCFV
jgi:sulfite exporter TauE/SafE